MLAETVEEERRRRRMARVRVPADEITEGILEGLSRRELAHRLGVSIDDVMRGVSAMSGDDLETACWTVGRVASGAMRRELAGT